MTYFVSERVAAPSPDMPFGYTYDPHGRVLTFKDSDGYWYEYTRDPHGRVLTYKNSGGHWYEYTRDPHGRVLTYKHRDGRDMVALARTDDYTLYFNKPTRTYRAGCREFTRAEALAHWGAPRDDNRERAEIFMSAIKDFEEPQ